MDSSFVVPAIAVGLAMVVGVAMVYTRSKERPVGMDPENWQPFQRMYTLL
jgi:hypothetical protein